MGSGAAGLVGHGGGWGGGERGGREGRVAEWQAECKGRREGLVWAVFMNISRFRKGICHDKGKNTL